MGYRWFVRQLAESLGVSGWVRNREDGSVEAQVEGPQDALEELESRLRTGNPAARVDSIESRPLPPQGDGGFRIAV